MATQQIVERRLGSPYPSAPLRFLKQVVPKKQNALLAVDLPAQLIRCGSLLAGGITPIARIVLSGAKPYAAACVTASVADDAALGEAAQALRSEVGRKEYAEAALRLMSTTHSFEDVVALAPPAGAGAGCGCGCGASVSLPAGLCVGVAVKRDDFVWSEPVAATLIVKPGYGEDLEPIDLKAPGFIVFNCNSDWYWKGFFGNRYTLCEGACKGPPAGRDCTCDASNPAHPRLCKGWTSCTCV